MAVRRIPFYGEFKTNGYLSNFYIAPFVEDGVTYNCSEQYFMAKKAEAMGDPTTRDKILAEASPKKQKKLGRQVSPWDEEKWVNLRETVMLDALALKFTQNPMLRDLLVGTKDFELVEASPRDKVWGAGMGKARVMAGEPLRGTNLLGKCLMMVRKHLQTIMARGEVPTTTLDVAPSEQQAP